MQRKDNESYLSYVRRVTEACSDKRISYSEWGDCVLGADNVYSSDNLRKAFYCVSKMLNKVDNDSVDDSVFEELESLREEIRKERVKLQTVNIERNRIDRQDARYELFYEQIGQYIQKSIPPQLECVHTNKGNNKKYIQVITDVHFGGEFASINNEYSPKIVKDRFEILLDETIKFIEEKGLTEITVVGLQDFIQGMIHTTDLRINDSSVVKAVVEISHIIADYLNKLSAYVEVTYVDCLFANHSQTRPLGTKANQLMDEDLGYVIGHYIEDMLSNNNRITVVLSEDDDTFVEVPNIFGFNIICAHGHQIKNVERALADLTMQRRKFYDVCILGHYHASKEMVVGESYGHDLKCLTAPSFIGSDPFSDSLYKGSKGAVAIYGFDEMYGHTETYKIILN